MGTAYPEIFAALARPFAPQEVKQRSAPGGRKLSYITARTAMNRLDEVLGPENWWDTYHPLENSVVCKLTIRLPDGQELTKSDAGGYAGMADSGDDDKSGFSDAFKRGCAKFGIGRYLYQDGVPRFDAEPPTNGHAAPPPSQVENRATSPPSQVENPAPRSAPSNGTHTGAPQTGKALYAWVKEQEQRHNVGLPRYMNGWAKLQEFPARMIDWDADQTAYAYTEAVRKLKSFLPGFSDDGGSQVENHSPPPPNSDNGPHTGAPRTGGGLFKWAKEQDEATGLSVSKGIDAWAKANGFDWQWKNWDEATVAAAHAYAMGKIAGPDVSGVQQGLPEDGPEPIESVKKKLKRAIIDLACQTYRVDRPDKAQIDATMGVLRNLAGACSKPMLTAVDPLGEEQRDVILFYIDQAVQEMEVIAKQGALAS